MAALAGSPDGFFETAPSEYDASQFEPVNDAGSARMLVVRAGEGPHPPVMSHVYALVRGRTAGGHVFLDSVAEEMEVVLGHGAVMGLQLAALKLRRGARAVVLCGAGMGYAEGREPPGVAKGEDLYFQVEVVRFESEPNLHEMDVAQRVAFAEERRVIGKECFVMHRVRSALRQYDKGLLALQGPEAALGGGGNGREEEPDEAVLAHAQGRALLVTLLVNASLCHLRLKDYAATRHMASRALALEPRNAKALLRRGQALAALADAEGAQRDFRAALELVGDEETREKIRAALARAEATLKQAEARQRRTLGGFLEGTELYADRPMPVSKPSLCARVTDPLRRLCARATRLVWRRKFE